MKRVRVDRARELCNSVRLGRKNPRSKWWNDVLKAAIERKEVARKDVLGAKNENVKCI